MNKNLTPLQAFNAMAKLFQIYYDLDPSGDIGGILGSMAFLPDQQPIDRAMLQDWQECLDESKENTQNNITTWQAFVAMGIFLENFFGTKNISWEIQFLQDNARQAHSKQNVDPVLWQYWLQSINEVLSVEDSRDYFQLLPKNH